jgi:hypothetical protein
MTWCNDRKVFDELDDDVAVGMDMKIMQGALQTPPGNRNVRIGVWGSKTAFDSAQTTGRSRPSAWRFANADPLTRRNRSFADQ